MDSLVAYYGDVQVVMVRYHTDYPWEYDPFYLANPTESDARYDFYSGSDSHIPMTIVDGKTLAKKCFMEEFRAEINARLGISSPLKMVASDSLTLDSCFVNLSVIAEGTPSGDSLKLRVAVVEDSIYYEAPNGQTVFKGVFRSFIPGPEGIDFEISQGETLDFDFAFELDPVWDTDVISTVAFVQDETDLGIIQAASTRPRPTAWARYYAPQQGDIANSGSALGFPGTVMNLGSATDTFDIDIVSDLPADWSAGYQVSGGVVVPGGVALEPDSSCTIEVQIGCGYEPGTGEVGITLTSSRDPAFARTLDFFGIAGACALIIDDDSGDDLETYYEGALDSIGVIYGTWDRSIADPDSSDLGMAEFVIWAAGVTFPTLTSYDREILAAYHDGGGRLFISGQDIGYRLCNVQSDEYSPEAKTFYETYLHASYVAPNSHLWELSGRTGDPIGDDIDLVIEGGDGADNQTYPDVIDSIAPARVVFDYSDPLKHGGVRFESGSTQVVYLSFGFEAISNAADRVLLMSRIVNWFGITAGITDRNENLLSVTCYPNPAVSYATIGLGPGGGAGSVRIYDVMGRTVTEGSLPERGTFTWDLKDLRGGQAAPGVYFVTVSTGRQTSREKLVITR